MHTAIFTVHGQHEARVDYTVGEGLDRHDGVKIGGFVNCHTCSLSLVATKAIEFMLVHGVRKLDVDGCQIVRKV